MSILDKDEKLVRGKVLADARACGFRHISIDKGGWPDDLLIGPRGGLHAWVEFKRPSGGRFYRRQIERGKELVERGCLYFAVNNEEEGYEIIRELLDATSLPGEANTADDSAGSSGGSTGPGAGEDVVLVGNFQSTKE